MRRGERVTLEVEDEEGNLWLLEGAYVHVLRISMAGEELYDHDFGHGPKRSAPRGIAKIELDFDYAERLAWPSERKAPEPERPTPRSSGPEGPRFDPRRATFRVEVEGFKPFYRTKIEEPEPEEPEPEPEPKMGKCPRCGASGPVGARCPNPDCSADAERRRRQKAADFFRDIFSSFPGAEPWRTLLGNPLTLAQAETSYRRLTKERHPDRPGGSDAAMAELNAAIAAARRTLG